jgi:hypothetical protein
MNTLTEATPEPIDLSQYRILVAGSFTGSVKELAALSRTGVTVSVVAHATAEARKRIEALPLHEAIFVESDNALLSEAFRRASAPHLVVLAGEKADMLERTLLPLLQECAVASLDDLLPLERLDDPKLRYLRTAQRWGYYLVGRALGLPPETARAYMKDCCGYEKQNQNRK